MDEPTYGVMDQIREAQANGLPIYVVIGGADGGIDTCAACPNRMVAILMLSRAIAEEAAKESTP